MFIAFVFNVLAGLLNLYLYSDLTHSDINLYAAILSFLIALFCLVSEGYRDE